jgi:hypothetical protein
VSLLIARKTDHPKIKLFLESQNLKTEIVNLFPTQKFKASANAVALYHQDRFDRLLPLFQNNPELTFSGKPTMLLHVTECLKLPNQSDPNHFSPK